MRYEVLGPMRLVDGEAISFISAPKIEVLLAALLIRSDQVVPTDTLFTEVWGSHPPRRASAGLHVYISQLRKFLHRPGRTESPIVTRPPGYCLRLGSDELDAHVFLDLVGQGRHSARAGHPQRAAACFEQALELWRGPVLGDLARGPIIDGFATWLAEERLECFERLNEARLAMGQHRELVGRLLTLTVEHPLRETFYKQLMLALYRSERRADALDVYQSARRVLNAELGVEPCRSLQNLQQAILSTDDRLDLYAGPEPVDSAFRRIAAMPAGRG
jgi:SARP family transcriptional regulator, regulator of embCAB operon